MNSSNLQSCLAKPHLRAKVDRELATRSFREFVRQAWSIIEPLTPFVPGWHIDAIIDHLEAVTRGEIRNLSDQRSPASHEEPARVGAVAGLGMDSASATALAFQQLCGDR